MFTSFTHVYPLFGRWSDRNRTAPTERVTVVVDQLPSRHAVTNLEDSNIRYIYPSSWAVCWPAHHGFWWSRRPSDPPNCSAKYGGTDEARKSESSSESIKWHHTSWNYVFTRRMWTEWFLCPCWRNGHANIITEHDCTSEMSKKWIPPWTCTYETFVGNQIAISSYEILLK